MARGYAADVDFDG